MNTLLWSFWALFPIVGFIFIECDDAGGVAKAPGCLLATYMPVVAYTLYIEFNAHKLVLPACASWLGGWRVFGRNVPFFAYLGMTIGLSALGHADLATSALFSARIIKTVTCPDNLIEPTWDRVVAHSWMRYLPSLDVIAGIAWLALASQLLLSLGQSIPFPKTMRRPNCVGLRFWLFDVRAADVDLVHPSCYWIPTYLQGQVYASSAVHALSTSGRMGCLSFRYFDLFNYAYGPKARGGIKDLRPSRDSVVAEMNLCSVNVATFLLLESSLQSNLQMSVLLVANAATNTSAFDPLTTMSILLTILMAIYKLSRARLTLKKIYKDMEPYIQPDDTKQVNDPGYNRLDTREIVMVRRQRVIRARYIFTVSAFVTIVLLLYAVAKFVGGAFACASGLWNLSGCV